MVSKCANPSCSAQFRYLCKGKLFLMDTSHRMPVGVDSVRPSSLHRYWLCENCSRTFTIEVEDSGEIKLTALEREHLSRFHINSPSGRHRDTSRPLVRSC